MTVMYGFRQEISSCLCYPPTWRRRPGKVQMSVGGQRGAHPHRLNQKIVLLQVLKIRQGSDQPGRLSLADSLINNFWAPVYGWLSVTPSVTGSTQCVGPPQTGTAVRNHCDQLRDRFV